MNQLITQFRELAPSAKEPLFRRLMVDESLSYLREKNSIVGFEVDTRVEQTLSGFTLIGIQKHTIYAYCTDLHEDPKLILFPPIDKLFDPDFELLGLSVIKREFHNSTFVGTKLGEGKMKDLVRDLTPPEKEVDIPETVVEQMAGHVKAIEEGTKVVTIDSPQEEIPVKVTKEEPVVEEPESFTEEPPEGFIEEPMADYESFDSYEEPGYDEYDDYGDYGDDGEEPAGWRDTKEEEPVPEEPKEDPRSTALKAQTFSNLSDVSDYCHGQLHVQRALAVNVVNKALQSNVAPEFRIALAVKLFCKLFDEKKI